MLWSNWYKCSVIVSNVIRLPGNSFIINPVWIKVYIPGINSYGLLAVSYLYASDTVLIITYLILANENVY